MLLRLEDILPEGIDIEVRLDPDDPAVRELEIKGPVNGSFNIRKIGRQVLVRGSVRGEASLTCARCLSRFDALIREEVDIELRPIGDLESSVPERELGADDLDVEFFRGDVLDTGHLAAEQITLAVPMKPLCSPECGGICPECGADKGGECRCAPAAADPRWNALKDLRERMEKKK